MCSSDLIARRESPFGETANFLNAVNHIFLPRKLPGELDDLHLVEVENYILQRFAAFLKSQQFHDAEFERVQRMFLHWSSLQCHPLPTIWAQRLTALAAGDSFAFYIREQNSAILITRLGKSFN